MPNPTDRKPVRLRDRLGLVLFGLPFLGFGLYAGYSMVLEDLRTWHVARAYVPVSAELTQLELDERYDNDDNSKTYKVKAVYRYDYQGSNYSSERVAISDSSDNIGDYHRRLYARLYQAQQQQKPVTAWIDPHNPSQGLLDREMRWKLFAFKSLFFVLFTTIGLSIAVFAFKVAPPPLADTLQRGHSGANQGQIVSGSRGAVWGVWFLAFLWNAISSSVLLVLPDELAKQNWKALIGLVFPLVGLFLIYYAVCKTLQWKRFGALNLNIQPFPAATGGMLQSSIEFRERFPGNVQFQVTLTCIHKRTTGSGKHRRTSEHAVWQDEVLAASSYGAQGTRLDFRFVMPAGLPASETPSLNYHYWKLNIKAEVPGVNLDHDFEIPVIAGTLDSGEIRHEASAPATGTRSVPEIPANIVRIGHAGGATVFYYPPLRSPGGGFGFLIFGAISAIPMVILHRNAGEIADVTGIFALQMFLMNNLGLAIFGLFAAGMLLLGLYWLTNTLRVEASSLGLVSKRKAFGITLVRRAAAGEISRLEHRVGSQTQSGGKFSLRYRLIAHLRNGREITVGDDIPGLALAQHMQRLLQEALQLKQA